MAIFLKLTGVLQILLGFFGIITIFKFLTIKRFHFTKCQKCNESSYLLEKELCIKCLFSTNENLESSSLIVEEVNKNINKKKKTGNALMITMIALAVCTIITIFLSFTK